MKDTEASQTAQSASAFTKVAPVSTAVLPKPPKAGYLVFPSMVELENMSADKLKKVSEFRVWNEHGSVEFLGETDVSGVDLADIITIAKNSVEVYDDVRHVGGAKPAVGQKLNRPALITLRNMNPRPS